MLERCHNSIWQELPLEFQNNILSWACGAGTIGALSWATDDIASIEARYTYASTHSSVWSSNIGSQNQFTRVFVWHSQQNFPEELHTTMFEEADCQGRIAMFFAL